MYNPNDPNQNYPPQYQNYPPPSQGSAWAGFGIAIGLHFIFQPFIAMLGMIPNMEWFYFSVFFIGLSQLIYMIPAIILASVKGKPHLVKGLAIGAGLTFLLNAACTGLVFGSYQQGKW